MPLILLPEAASTPTQEPLTVNTCFASMSSTPAYPKSYRPQLTREALLTHAFGQLAFDKWRTRTTIVSSRGSKSECGSSKSSRSASLGCDRRCAYDSFTPPPLGTFRSVSRSSRQRHSSVDLLVNPIILAPSHVPSTWDSPSMSPGDAQFGVDRERLLTPAEWNEKAEERRRLKLMRQSERVARARAGTMSMQLPLGITCDPNEGLMNFAPAVYESLPTSTKALRPDMKESRRRKTGVPVTPSGPKESEKKMVCVKEQGREADENSLNQAHRTEDPESPPIEETTEDDLASTVR